MKRLPLVILVFAVLVAVVAGCSHSARYDGRLVAADSLMRDSPDSTLAIVEGLCRDSLATEGDRAYRDLLLTQARYRCYVTATSDSDINRALAYYRAHPKEREKLTRANIFKGAVMDELGFPDSAMRYYKQAEVVADTADYFNLGYAKLRMGTLYLDNYAMDGQHIKKLEEAISYFRRCSNTHYELRSMTILGAVHRLKNPEKAQELLTEAMNRASQINDTANFIFSAQNLMQAHYEKKRYDQAAKIVRKLMKNRDQNLNFAFYANSADIYAKIGKPDSAEYILGLADKGLRLNAIDEIMYFESLGEIARARGDKETYNLMDKKCQLMEDSLLSLKGTLKIIQAETSFDQMSLDENRHISDMLKRTIITLTILVAIIFLSIYLLHRKRKHRYSQLINDLMEESQNHVSDINTLRRNIDQLKIRDSQLKDFITSYIELMGDVTEACYHSPKNVLSNEISRLFQIKEENKDRWVELYSYIDNEYNQIITDTINKYSQLNDRDILLLALTCLDFSCAQIAIITGYSNATSISGNRQRLAKKMGLDHSLQEYINQYKSPQESN